MRRISSPIDSIRQYMRRKELFDFRLLGLVVIGIVAVSVFWNGAKIIQQNYILSQKVTAIREQNELIELENRNKELQNEYLKTDEYADITARRLYGKAAPGERVYVVPRDVALNALSAPIEEEPVKSQAVETTCTRPNIEEWLKIYLGD